MRLTIMENATRDRPSIENYKGGQGMELECFSKLREVRKGKGMTQKALSEASGVPREQINRYERGIVVPTLTSAAKLAEALKCSVDDLIDVQRRE